MQGRLVGGEKGCKGRRKSKAFSRRILSGNFACVHFERDRGRGLRFQSRAETKEPFAANQSNKQQEEHVILDLEGNEREWSQEGQGGAGSREGES